MSNQQETLDRVPVTLKNLTVGLVGFGEVNTPRDIIDRKYEAARSALVDLGIRLVDTPPVSDDPGGEDVRRAVRDLSAVRPDVLVICIAGWIPTHAVISVISEFKDLPMLLWGLAGYYEDGRLITTADQAGTTALRNTMADLGYRFSFLYDCPGRPLKIAAVKDFLLAAGATRHLSRARIGMMGYRDMNLYATLCDAVSLKKTLGVEIETFEMLDMVQRGEHVTPDKVEVVVELVKRKWKFAKPAEKQTLEKSIRYYLALKSIIEERRYDAISLIDVDGMKKLLRLPPAMIFMLLADELGLPTIPENDSLGSVTQLIIRALTGQSAAYFEFYEFMEDRLLVGVPDYVPAAVVDGDICVLPTRFGNFSEGILNVSKVKTGAVTLTRLVPRGQGYAIHAVTGVAVTPRPWEEAGWQQPAPQLPGLEIILDTPVESFANNVACQHYILSYGDATNLLKVFCRLNQIDLI